MQRLVLIVGWLLASLAFLAARADAQVQVNARLSSGIVKLGSPAALILEVEGASDVQLGAPPAVDGLHFGKPSGPSRQDYVAFLNGRRTSSTTLTWSFAISADRKGEYKIPAIEVTADGKSARSNEVWLRIVEDLQGEQLGRFEIAAPSTVVEGQPFTVELRFGWDTRLDREVNRANLSLPWYGELGGVVELDPPPAEPGVKQITGVMINNSGNYAADSLDEQKTGDGTFRTMRMRRRFLAARAGKLEFSTSHLEFGRVSQDFLLQRESKLYYKRFAAFTIDVVALPEKERPLDFSGAVGVLRASARADRTDVDVGDSIKLSVEWTGEGNLEFFNPPELDRLDAFQGFRCFGKASERKTADRRVLTYDLAPTTDKLTQIPPVPLSVFDPKQNAYVTITTQPVPIRVRALKNATGLSDEGPAKGGDYDIRDIQTGALALVRGSAPGAVSVWSSLALVACGWIGTRTWVRRQGDPSSPLLRRRRRARKELERQLSGASSAAQQARALQAFLAARSGERAEAWIGRDVLAWREARAEGTRPGLDETRALSALLDELDGNCWGGRDVPIERGRILSVADALVKGGL